MNVAHLLLRTAATHPGRPAMAVGSRVVHDYGMLARRASALARALDQDRALLPGDRVALVAANCAEYLEIMQAAWIAGLVIVPINAKLHPKEAAFILEDCGAAMVFADESLATALQPLLRNLASLRHVVVIGSDDYEAMTRSEGRAPHEGSSDDVAWLFYTSGTTGQPKGVMLTHRNLLAMTLCYYADVDTAQPGDAFVHAAPMSHGSGLYSLAQLRAGARHVIPESASFDADEFFRLAAAHGNATMFAAPTMVKRLVDHAAATGARADPIRTIVYGGAPMYAADIRRALAVLGDRFVQIYGQGESPMTITAVSRALHADRGHPRYEERLASVGVAQSAVEVRVVDDEGHPLTAGTAGEVVVRGDTVMRGYWRNREATARALRDGWLFTGDVGALDGEGFLTLKDRSKDVIISGGSNIYPREVEEALLRHAGVAEVCVVGRPHPDWGEEVVAFVVLRPGARTDAQALDAVCLDNIARFKRPKTYHFVAALPKNNYGKVLKREVRAWLTDGTV